MAGGIVLLALGLFLVLRTVRGERKLPDLLFGGGS